MKYKFLLLSLIVLVGAGIRLYKIGEIPRGYTFDEAGIIYDAWSISLWHRDQFAHFMPLSFQSFGDYKPPVMIYTLAGIYKVFGLREVAIRYVSALAGIGSIVMIYWLAVGLFGSPIIGLVSASVIAFSPWSIHLSRIGFEQNLTFFLGLTGIACLVYALKHPRWWLPASGFLALSMYTFHTAKIFIPISLLIFGWVYRKEIKEQILWSFVSLGTFVVLLIPLGYSSLAGNAGVRSQTLIHSFEELGVNLLNYLSPGFWMFGWDGVSIRHAVPGFGVLLIPVAILLIFNLFWHRSQQLTFLRLLLLAGLLPGIISSGSPHVIRSQFALIAVALLVGQAVVKIFKRKFALVLFFCLVLLQLSHYLVAYFGSYASDSAAAFQYGYQEAIVAINKYKQGEERVFVTDSYLQPYIYLLLYNRITPQQFLFGGLNQYQIQPIKWSAHNQKGLYLATPVEIPITDSRVKTIITIPNTNTPVLVVAHDE